MQIFSSLQDQVQLIFLLLFSGLLGFGLAYLYRFTHRGFSYSQSFSVSLVLITVITTLTLTLIEDNIARAIGIFGAFSIIRFRTAVKDVKDIVYVFLALSLGLSVGIGKIDSSIVGFLFIALLIYFLHFTNFGGIRKMDFVLTFKFDTSQSSNGFKKLMKKYLKSSSLLNVESLDSGQKLIYKYDVDFKQGKELQTFLDEINNISGVSEVNILSSKNDLEY